MSINQTIPFEMLLNDRVISNDLEICESYNTYFYSTFSSALDCHKLPLPAICNFEPISEKEVGIVLKCISPTSSIGPNWIPTVFIKRNLNFFIKVFLQFV